MSPCDIEMNTGWSKVEWLLRDRYSVISDNPAVIELPSHGAPSEKN